MQTEKTNNNKTISVIKDNDDKYVILIDGKKIVEDRFTSVTIFNDNFAIVSNNDSRCNCINLNNGKYIFDEFIYYCTITNTSNSGLFFIVKPTFGSMVKVFCEYGLVINETEFDYMSPFRNGFFVVKVNGKYNYVDENFNPLSNVGFDYALPFCESGFASIKHKGGYKFIDKNGKIYKKLPIEYNIAK